MTLFSTAHVSVNICLCFHTDGNLNFLCNDLNMCNRFWCPFRHDIPSRNTKLLNVPSQVDVCVTVLHLRFNYWTDEESYLKLENRKGNLATVVIVPKYRNFNLLNYHLSEKGFKIIEVCNFNFSMQKRVTQLWNIEFNCKYFFGVDQSA